ncbi:MAG: biopolymer transporter ExbD [Polyangiaceae bacterium]
MGATISAASSRKPRSREPVQPDINVTPLVDVVLVLLIIFMVIAPEMEHGERVELPAIVNTDDTAKKPKDPVTVTISAAGNFFIEKEAIPSVEALTARLRDEHDKDPEKKLVLKADSGLPYEKIRSLLAAFQQNGLAGVSLSVTQKGQSAAKAGEER